MAKLRAVAPPERLARNLAPDKVVWHLNLDQIESQTGRILEKKRAKVSEAGSSTFAFDEGHVLYSKLRPYLNKVVRPDEPGIATSELVPLRPLPDVLNPDFLKFYLRSDRFVGFANQVVAGAKMPRMIMDKFWQHEIPLPAPREQRRIVDLLELADALRRQRTESVHLADLIRPVLFQKMFGDPSTNSKNWDKDTLGAAGALVRYGLGQPPQSSDNGLPLIRATNIHRGLITTNNLIYVRREDVPESRNAFLKADEVIVVRSGAYTGDIAQVTEEWAGSVAGYDLVVSPGEKFTGEFLESYLLTSLIQQNYFGNIKARAGQPHLNADQLLNTPMMVPPKPLQEQFSRLVVTLRNQQVKTSESVEHLNNLFASMVHHSFTGELTAKWREAHLKELLVEMEHQAKMLRTAAETN